MFSRRDFLETAGNGFGAVALAGLMAGEGRAARPAFDPTDPLTARPPHFPAKAKSVIFLFMYGGPSQVDTFDYKPTLAKLHGKPIPADVKAKKDKVAGVFKNCKDELLAGPWGWKRRGQSGLWVSDLLPHTAGFADDLCVVRSMTSESSNHAPATYQMNTGATTQGKPSAGAWVTYGLGSENRNLPGFVLLYKIAGLGGSPNWGNGFLPAAFQGTRFRHEGTPLFDLGPPADLVAGQRATLDLAQAFNRMHRDARPGVPGLDGRIAAYELAYRMQSEAIDVGDVEREPLDVRESYGLTDPNKDTAAFGRQCLLARRLVEKGVRFVQIYSSVDKSGWDGHDDLVANHKLNAAITDRPTAALLGDLKRRGMLDSTLVVWAGEFGRTPMLQGKTGRSHNPYGFSVWMAGGGVKGGQAIGTTDEIGLRAVERPYRVKDLHATILAALGLDHEKLSYDHSGRPERLTGVAGSASVIPGVLG